MIVFWVQQELLTQVAKHNSFILFVGVVGEHQKSRKFERGTTEAAIVL